MKKTILLCMFFACACVATYAQNKAKNEDGNSTGAYTLKLDSVAFGYPWGTISVYTRFKYDNQGRCVFIDNGTGTLSNVYNADGSWTCETIGASDKSTTNYSKDGDILTYVNYGKDVNGNWYEKDKHIKTYDLNGMLLTDEEYDWINEKQVPKAITHYTYNTTEGYAKYAEKISYENGVECNKYEYAWDDHDSKILEINSNYSDNTWNQVLKVVSKYSYNTSDGYAKYQELYDYQSDGNVKVSGYAYDSDDNQVAYVEYKKTGVEWQKVRKSESYKDSEIQTSYYISYLYDDDTKSWIPNSKQEDIYLDANHISKTYTYNYDTDKKEWYYNMKTEMDYDANGGYTSQNSSYNVDTKKWSLTSKVDYACDAMGQQILLMLSYYNGTKWIPEYKNEWQYATWGVRIADSYSVFYNNTWIKMKENTYYATGATKTIYNATLDVDKGSLISSMCYYDSDNNIVDQIDQNSSYTYKTEYANNANGDIKELDLNKVDKNGNIISHIDKAVFDYDQPLDQAFCVSEYKGGSATPIGKIYVVPSIVKDGKPLYYNRYEIQQAEFDSYTTSSSYYQVVEDENENILKQADYGFVNGKLVQCGHTSCTYNSYGDCIKVESYFDGDYWLGKIGKETLTSATVREYDDDVDASSIAWGWESDKTQYKHKIDADISYDADFVETSRTIYYYSPVGESTSISGINTQTTSSSKTYNIMGQRVGANTKGLLIRNGRKFLIK